MVMSTLAQRLQKVQLPQTTPEFDFSKYTMDQLETYRIKFGKTHVGQTFNHMWCHEQKWVLWFSQHYSQSTKWEHRLFLHYVELKVERCELSGIAVPVTSSRSKEAQPTSMETPPMMLPQAKARMAPTKCSQPSVWDQEVDTELFEVINEGPPEENLEAVSHMEARMATLENAINHIIHHLEEKATSSAVEQ